MKKILLIIILTIITFSGYTQTLYQKYSLVSIDTNEYVPKYLIGEIDNKKDTLGIVITISQAQKIDNDYELLSLYKSMHTDCDSSVSFLIQVVNNYKKLTVVAQERFKEDSISIIDYKNQINNLKEQISIENNLVVVKDSIITTKDDLLKINNLKLKQVKKERNRTIEICSSITAFFIWFAIGHPGIK